MESSVREGPPEDSLYLSKIISGVFRNISKAFFQELQINQAVGGSTHVAPRASYSTVIKVQCVATKLVNTIIMASTTSGRQHALWVPH